VTPWKNGNLSYVVMNHVKVFAFGSQKLLQCSNQRRREPQRGRGKHSRWAKLGNFFFRILLFKMADSGVLKIFERRRGAQTSRGLG